MVVISDICDYSAAQMGVVGFVHSVEVDTLARGLSDIQFTTLNPAFVHSEFFNKAK